MRITAWSVLLLVAGPLALTGQAAAPTVKLTINAALVDGEMQVRPVPLHALRLITDKGDTLSTRTGVDGTATLAVPPGEHALESVAPLTFQGREYVWRMTVAASTALIVALTNDNAIVGDVATSAPAPERFDAAASLYQQLSRSVFRVEAGLAHGTGFLIDTLGGVILTNAHVIESGESNRIALALDSVARVRARVLAIDSESDVAVLQVHPDHLSGRHRIPLQRPVGQAPVTPGERLIAMGYPLSQNLTLTTGIASSVRAGAVISDVNINHGNSGGPLLNVAGEAVAINTFGEDRGTGPGVSGSVLVARAGPALARAASELARGAPPSGRLLPLMPTEALSVATLKAYADTVDPRRYRKMSDIGVAGFDVTVQTPAQTFVSIRMFDEDMAKDRKKREALSNLPEAQRYSSVREYRDWAEYVGEPALPVISFSVRPAIGETTGSLFARMLLSAQLQANYKFRGDVRGVTVLRDSVEVEPIRGGHIPMTVYEENRWISLKDVADQGFYTFDAELFRPHTDGAPPVIVIAISDLKNPKKLKCKELSAEVVANAWNDFEIFYEQLRPAAGFTRADRDAAKGRKPIWRTGFMKSECDWSY
jgi:S1-C subfamily serine protease